MLTFYGNDVELFAVCDKCGKIWEIVGDKFNLVKYLPMGVEYIPDNVCFGIDFPTCDCQ